jgi:hypothetical protein
MTHSGPKLGRNLAVQLAPDLMLAGQLCSAIPARGRRMQFNGLRRRDFLTLLGGAAAWPLALRAQQPLPVIGMMFPGGSGPERRPAFIQALTENGFIEGHNVEFDFRWGPWEQSPAMAAELVRRRVAVIRTGGPPGARAAMAATKTIPIVFIMGEDPVKEGVVASLARPGGNVTGFAALWESVSRQTAPTVARGPSSSDDGWISGKSAKSEHRNRYGGGSSCG